MRASRSLHLMQFVEWHGRQLCMRPLRPSDALEHRAFFTSLAPAALRIVTLGTLRPLATGGAAALAQPAASVRDAAFIATLEDDAQASEALGVVRSAADARNDTAEFVLLLDERAKGRGLGRLLLGKLVDYCQQRGTRRLVGESAIDDQPLIALARAYAFEVECSDVAGMMRLTLALQPAPTH